MYKNEVQEMLLQNLCRQGRYVAILALKKPSSQQARLIDPIHNLQDRHRNANSLQTQNLQLQTPCAALNKVDKGVH